MASKDNIVVCLSDMILSCLKDILQCYPYWPLDCVVLVELDSWLVSKTPDLTTCHSTI